jgi:hypothetical protein
MAFALTISPSQLRFCLELRVLLICAMEDEHSPIIDIVGDTSKAPLMEVSMASSKSDASSGGAASDMAKAETEDAVDPRELAWNYDFGASSITVGRIRQLKALGYFTKGLVREPGEEIVPEPNTNEAVVFKEFFCNGAVDATSSSSDMDSTQVSGAPASVDSERYRSAI